MEYTLFDESHQLDLEATVTRKLSEGWALAGSAFYAAGRFYQPMTRGSNTVKTRANVGGTITHVIDEARLR